jgi:uncharacterized protein YjbI with pentapeptide repeats
MGWVDIESEVARPPRVATVTPAEIFVGTLDVDRGWAELLDVSVDADRLDLGSCSELSITETTMRDVTFDTSGEVVVEAWRSSFDNTDLSPLRFGSVRSTTFVGCKFVGTDFADGRLENVLFDRCTFRYVNLRMAKLSRVEFRDCTLDDVDVYDATLEDVGFPISRLVKFNVDRVKATRVDLREAAEIDLASLSRLDGFVVGEDQLPLLMYALAFASGLSVERPSAI